MIICARRYLICVLFLSVWILLQLDLRQSLLHSLVRKADDPSATASLINQSETKFTEQNNTSPLFPENVTCIPPRPLHWEWSYYSRQARKRVGKKVNVQAKHKSVLVAMFAGYDSYASLLEETAPINKAYAKRWQFDTVVLQGTAYIDPKVDGNCTPPGRRTTINKIALLRQAYMLRETYDQILIVDTDAVMYGFDVDVSSLLPDDMLVAGHRVSHRSNETHTYNINAGVLLWNLHHPLLSTILQDWHRRSLHDIRTGTIKGDQRPLHQTLRVGNRSLYVHSLQEEFAYGHGSVVRHFIRRPDHRNWTDPHLVGAREEKIARTRKEICRLYYESEEECQNEMDHVSYTTY